MGSNRAALCRRAATGASFTACLPDPCDSEAERSAPLGFLAIALFVALFGFGQRFFGWSDPGGKVQLALVASFVLGIMTGFKNR
jgi:hypothetical protein